MDPSWDVTAVEGDQRISEESVDVDRRVSIEADLDAAGVVVLGRHESEVIPASWPIRRASKVIENCCDLGVPIKSRKYRIIRKISYFPSSDLTVKT